MSKKKKATSKKSNGRSPQENAYQAISSLLLGLASGAHLHEVLSDSLQTLTDSFGLEGSVVFSASADNSQLQYLSSTEEIIAPTNITIDPSEPIELIADRGVGFFLGEDYKNGITLPLLYSENPYGVICFIGNKENITHEIDLILQTFAAQVAQAIYLESLSEPDSMDREIEFTHALKSEILSEEVPAIPGFNASLHLLRCIEGGGDFHDFIQLPSGRIAIIVGKTSGWGLKASLSLAHLIPMARGELSSGKSISQVLASMNDEIVRHRQGGQLVSIAIMMLDTRTRKVSICRAGSIKMLHFKGGKLSVFDSAPGSHLGAYSGVKIREVEMQFAPGDSLAFITDGISSISDNKSLTLSEITDTLGNKMQKEDNIHIAEQIATLLHERNSSNLPQQDVTILSIQREPKKTTGMKANKQPTTK